MPSDATQRLTLVYTTARFLAAVSILAGGVLHIAGLAQVFSRSANLPWYDWLVYVVAMAGYPVAAYFIIRDRTPGYVMAVVGPCVGGVLIFTGFISTTKGLLMLIPGTIGSEITLVGFLTLITEPMAVAASLVCLYLGPGRRPESDSPS
ncbi:MAG: hypothetical protein KKA60_04235 [Proteobacteria bacterium]|nr:hypothetical protein [Pseudomonadota bacterium]